MVINKCINLFSIDNSCINSLANCNKKNQEQQPLHRHRHHNNQLPSTHHDQTPHPTPPTNNNNNARLNQECLTQNLSSKATDSKLSPQHQKIQSPQSFNLSPIPFGFSSQKLSHFLSKSALASTKSASSSIPSLTNRSYCCVANRASPSARACCLLFSRVPSHRTLPDSSIVD